MNLLVITGNLTKDAELRYTNDSKAVLGFTIANNQGWGDNQHTEYYDCSMWGARAEKLAEFLGKGGKVTVQGEHRTENRDHNGKSYFNNKVFVKEIELGGQAGGQSGGQAPRQQAPQQQNQPAQKAPSNDFDDVPF